MSEITCPVKGKRMDEYTPQVNTYTNFWGIATTTKCAHKILDESKLPLILLKQNNFDKMRNLCIRYYVFRDKNLVQECTLKV